MLAISVTAVRAVSCRPCQADDPGATCAADQQTDLAMTQPGPVFRLLALIALSLLAGAAGAEPTTEAPFNVLGREDAPVAIVEFSDLQCPYCAIYALQTFPQVKRAYIDTGKVHYAAISFPLPMHAYAVPAAVAARCAGEQGKFWQYRDAVFADQAQLASDPFDALARKLHLDVAKFRSCRRDIRQDAAVREDLAMARQDGITSTPSFMIGRVVDGELQGDRISGAKSFEEFAAKIDALLREAR
jgi:protein-disulfide isomerase